MNPLIAQLLALAGLLERTEGVSADALNEVLRLLAACLVQQNPAAGAVVTDPGFSQALNDAAAAGAALAAEKTAAGLSLRFAREPYRSASTDPGRPFLVAGPFTDEGARLVQFSFYESRAMRSVSLDVELIFIEVHELLMRLPGDSVIDEALRVVTIPSGTVWLRAERLVPGALGYAVLRVSGGTLQFDQPATIVAPGGGIQVALGAAWTLTLEPEAAPAADVDGSDANAMTLQLPTQFELQSDGSSAVIGPIGVSGFGSTLSFDTPVGGPVAADQAIVFAYEVGATAWSVAGNRSPLLGLTGGCTVSAALWGLPLTGLAPDAAGDAAHGGLLGFRLQGTVQGALRDGHGQVPWADPTLLASADGFEWRSRRVDATARLTLGLWGPSRSDLDFGAGLTDLRFDSRRDGADILAWSGGRLRNRWDLPLDARGAPFGCDAVIDAFSIVAEADGLRRVALEVALPPPVPARLHGLALENLYLSVSPVRRLAFAASGAALDTLAFGRAQLLFDVMLGEPMLPDPYAANWPPSDQFQMTEGALAIALRWQPDAGPAVHVRLEQPIRFPEPGDRAFESDPRLGEQFRHHLKAQPEFMSLLDLSTRDHHFGVALESIGDTAPKIDGDNRLSVELRHVRLLMQPQVHWEPVQVVANPKTDPPTLPETLQSTTHGGQTLLGANAVKLVPVLPGRVSEEIAAVANGQRRAAALFSLPFGLRASVQMAMARKGTFPVPAVTTDLHAPAFDAGLIAARQLRLRATGGRRAGEELDPSRGMPGAMRQTAHVERSSNGLASVLPNEIERMLNFDTLVPVHAVDLSGYGLSLFSHWRREAVPPQVDAFGVTQVHLDVMIGRTVCELIEVRSVLACCQSRVVRTIVMERRNSGRVLRFDSGWQAIDDGLFQRYVPVETGVLRALRNIRRIRILHQPLLVLEGETLERPVSAWQPVIFDADAQIDDVVSGGKDGLVPALDHAGYIQVAPVWDPAKPVENTKEAPDAPRFAALFKAVGGSMGGAVDCRIRLGGTLEMHLQALQAGLALDDHKGLGFAVAAYGSPTLPRAGQWSAVRIDGATADVSPVDPRHGLPVIRRPGQPCTFRDPADARLVRNRPAAEYGLLMSTPSSRVLFPKPSIDPAQPGRLRSAPPLMADPTCLIQGSGAFPRAALALQAKELALFDISDANAWRLTQPDFSFAPPLPGVAGGGGWDLARHFVADEITGLVPPFNLQIDSALPAVPWQVLQPPDEFKLTIAPFKEPLLTIQSNFEALSGSDAGLPSPTLLFGPALEAVQDIVNSLRAFVDLPFDVDVHVTVGQGPSPSFAVQLNLKFRIGDGPDGRIDIGIGKFYGEFELDGEFQAALSGATHGRLSLVFQGDVQQGIIPPLIYAGGMFRFALQVRDGDKPVIELGLGTATSIGGDLIKGLLAVEATVKYGYTLVPDLTKLPESLKPGVMLGIDARAKLLAGLFALSFSADALARIERFNRDDKTVTIFADLRVAGSVQVAVFFKEHVDFRTQFEQRIPLAPLLIAAQVNPLLAVATTAVL